MFALLAASTVFGCLCARLVYEAVEPVLPTEFQFVTSTTLYYFPFYLLGFVLFASSRVQEAFWALRPAHLSASIVWLLLANGLFDSLPKKVAEALLLTGEAYFAFTVVATLMWVFRRWFSKGGRTTRFLSDAAYTVYLFHFAIIYVLATLFWDGVPGGSWRMWMIALVTLALTLALHGYVISRVSILRLVFNGRRV